MRQRSPRRGSTSAAIGRCGVSRRDGADARASARPGRAPRPSRRRPIPPPSATAAGLASRTRPPSPSATTPAVRFESRVASRSFSRETRLGLILQAPGHRQERAHELLELLVGRLLETRARSRPAPPRAFPRRGRPRGGRRAPRAGPRRPPRAGTPAPRRPRPPPSTAPPPPRRSAAAAAAAARGGPGSRVPARRATRTSAVVTSSKRLPATRARPRLLPRARESDRDVDGRRRAVGHESRGVEIAARGGHERRRPDRRRRGRSRRRSRARRSACRRGGRAGPRAAAADGR